MKKIFAAALALVLALSIIGCSVAPSAGEGDTAVVDSDEAVATIGDRKVTFGEYKQLFDAYAQYYAMMGYDISADEEGTKQLQDSIIDALVVNEIIAYQAAQSGYDKLSDEKLAEIEEQAAADLNSIVEEYRKQAESDAEADSGIDVEERLAEYIADEAEAYTGERMTAEEYGKWILENSTESAIGESFKEAMLKDVTVSDEEIKSWYDENLKTQQETYDNNPENYKADKEAEELYGGDPVLYVPEGYSRVLHILITPEDAISDEYSEKFSQVLASGEGVDLAWTGWLINKPQNIADGNLMPLDDLLAEYGQGIVDILGENVVEIHRNADDGKLYYLPSWQGLCGERRGWLVVTEIAELAGDTWIEDTEAALNKWRNNYSDNTEAFQAVLDQATKYLAAAKEAGKLGAGINTGRVFGWSMYNGTRSNPGVGGSEIGIPFEDNTFTVIDGVASEHYKLYAKTMADWYKEGYIRSDIMSVDTSTLTMPKNGEITEDDVKDGEKEIQKVTDKYVKEADAMADKKIKEIQEI